MSIFYYAAVAIILAYLGITVIEFKKIPISISNTYYLWKERGFEFLFTFVMWTVGLLILVYWVSVAEDYRCQFLSFVSVSGMCFVGAACAYKKTLTDEVHYTSAGIWAAGALFFFLVNSMYMPMVFGLVFGFVGWILNKRENITFWAEMACVMMMIVGIWLL